MTRIVRDLEAEAAKERRHIELYSKAYDPVLKDVLEEGEDIMSFTRSAMDEIFPNKWGVAWGRDQIMPVIYYEMRNMDNLYDAADYLCEHYFHIPFGEINEWEDLFMFVRRLYNQYPTEEKSVWPCAAVLMAIKRREDRKKIHEQRWLHELPCLDGLYRNSTDSTGNSSWVMNHSPFIGLFLRQ